MVVHTYEQIESNVVDTPGQTTVVMNHGSLFSGIGGFDLAAEWMGWTNRFHCEWEKFPRKVLQYHFPESKSYGDINEADFTIWNGKIDILTGGFPCQPYSAAGKRLGTEDERHLWPAMLRAIREIEPRWVIGENVYGLVSWNDGMVFEEVQADLENEGYEVQPYILPAAAVGAPHRRDRVWFVANNTNARTKSLRQQRKDTVYGFGTSTNTDLLRNNKCRKRGCLESQQPKNQEQSGGRWTGETGGLDAQSDATDTSEFGRGRGHQRSETNKDAQQSVGKSVGQHGHDVRSQDAGRSADAANAKVTGSEGQRIEGQGQVQINGRSVEDARTRWDIFPTKSPVCGGDDGIPRELDSITFPKWRNESIKAYGNAIVPQVAYQLFKTIEKHDELY